jgi:hypothetical protein
LEKKQQLYASEALRISLPIAPVRVKELGLMEDLSRSAIYCTGVFGRLNEFSQTLEEKRSLFLRRVQMRSRYDFTSDYCLGQNQYQ